MQARFLLSGRLEGDRVPQALCSGTREECEAAEVEWSEWYVDLKITVV